MPDQLQNYLQAQEYVDVVGSTRDPLQQQVETFLANDVVWGFLFSLRSIFARTRLTGFDWSDKSKRIISLHPNLR